MSFTAAQRNYQFEESYAHVKQVKVTNNLGRTALHLELVHLDGYFGEVREFDDIASAATGYICLDSEREIRTTQIETTDTFVVGQDVHFVSGAAAAAGKLRSVPAATSYAVGKCTYVSAGVAIGFKPFPQFLAGGAIENATEFEVAADATTALQLGLLIPLGARITGAKVECKATVGGGTMQLKIGGGGAAITDAMVCATDEALIYAASLTGNVVVAAGLEVETANAGDRGIMTIYWR